MTIILTTTTKKWTQFFFLSTYIILLLRIVFSFFIAFLSRLLFYIFSFDGFIIVNKTINLVVDNIFDDMIWWYYQNVNKIQLAVQIVRESAWEMCEWFVWTASLFIYSTFDILRKIWNKNIQFGFMIYRQVFLKFEWLNLHQKDTEWNEQHI